MRPSKFRLPESTAVVLHHKPIATREDLKDQRVGRNRAIPVILGTNLLGSLIVTKYFFLHCRVRFVETNVAF